MKTQRMEIVPMTVTIPPVFQNVLFKRNHETNKNYLTKSGRI